MFKHSKRKLTCLFTGCGSYREAQRVRRAEEDTEAIQGEISMISWLVIAKSNYNYYYTSLFEDVYSITPFIIQRDKLILR